MEVVDLDKKVILHGELSKLLYSLVHSHPYKINYIVTKMIRAYYQALKEVNKE